LQRKYKENNFRKSIIHSSHQDRNEIYDI